MTREEKNYYQREYRKINREKVSAIEKKSKSKRIIQCLEYNRNYRSKNREKYNLMYSKYRIKNRLKIRNWTNNYYKTVRRFKVGEEYRRNPQRKIANSIRGRINFLLKEINLNKQNSTVDIIGCSINFFKNFLEFQFTENMNWGNYGKYWEIDHIIPVSKFNLAEKHQLKSAFHYSNCRPLEKFINRCKNNKMPLPHQPFLI